MKFKPLHMFNPIRIEYMLKNIKKYFKLKKDKINILEGLKILDIAGGLISEPMARLEQKLRELMRLKKI